ITELPYQVNKANLIKTMAHLANDKKVEGIRDLRDESDREGMRVVIELTKTATPEIVLNQLYKHTDMSITYGMINLALVDNQPRILALPTILQCYTDHRFEVVTRRTEYLLKKAKERAHILEGLRIALENIDETIKIIKSSKNREEAHERLTERFGLSKIQIDSILAMQLQRLTGLEREKIDNEYKELLAKIEEYTAILADRMKVLNIIKKELLEIRDKYGRDRLTKIEDAAEGEMDDEAFIEKENVTIAITNTGYIKRMSQDEFKAQRRGGKGVIGMATKEEDHIKDIFTANTHDYLLFFTSTGQVRWLKVYQIPEGTRYSKGRAVTNLLNLKDGEEVCAILRSNNFDDEHFIVMATKKGVVKKTPASAFAKPRNGGIRGITLRDGDMLVEVRETDGTRDILIPTREGKAIRFNEKDVRSMGRTASGVRGIRLSKGDKVIGMTILDPEKAILTVTQKGYGKRTAIDDYRITRRGGKGIINLQVTDKTGKIVDSRAVRETEEILLVSKQGKIIRTNLSQIKIQGRNTQGVRIMRMDDGDVLAAVGRVIADAEPTDDADKEDAVENTNITTAEKDNLSRVIPSEKDTE
ncbi:MAG: DNA gyrase subunit A, partial [Candidatus Aenigmarchaeota archaeon]|nr:DNA gyrase subunit A [Candidatus Aenigmarchaeota archaeon]